MSAQKQQNNKARNRTKYTQITDVMNFSTDPKKLKEELKALLIFDEAIESTVPDSKIEIKFNRITIGIMNPDGTEGHLIIETDKLYCFSVQESKQPGNDVLTGYSMALSMHSRDNPTERQLQTINFITVFSEIVKEHLLQDEIKASVNMFDLEPSQLKKVNPLFYKKETVTIGGKKQQKLVEGAAPSMYPKLLYFKAGKDKKGNPRPEQVVTKFYPMDVEEEFDDNGKPLPLPEINPLEYLDKPFHTISAIKIDSIFINPKTINLQLKVTEGFVENIENTRNTSLLRTSVIQKRQIGMGIESNPLLRKSSVVESPSISNTSIENKSEEKSENKIEQKSESKTEQKKNKKVDNGSDIKETPIKNNLVGSDDENHEPENENEEVQVKVKKPKTKINKNKIKISAENE